MEFQTASDQKDCHYRSAFGFELPPCGLLASRAGFRRAEALCLTTEALRLGAI